MFKVFYYSIVCSKKIIFLKCIQCLSRHTHTHTHDTHTHTHARTLFSNHSPVFRSRKYPLTPTFVSLSIPTMAEVPELGSSVYRTLSPALIPARASLFPPEPPVPPQRSLDTH